MTPPTTATSSLLPSNPAEVTRRVAFLAGPGQVLGSSLDYRITLQVVFVTDGVLEARRPDPDAFGPVELFDDARLLETVRTGVRAADSADGLASRIEEAALAFSGESPSDDMAILVVRVRDEVPAGG